MTKQSTTDRAVSRAMMTTRLKAEADSSMTNLFQSLAFNFVVLLEQALEISFELV